MTKDDALRMMLGPFKAWRDTAGNEDVAEELTKIITAAENALAQRTWVDLTDTQIENVYFDMVQIHRGAPMPWGQVQFGRALLEKFKEVNT